MRKGIVIFGVFLLIIGFLALLFAGLAYSNDMATLNSVQGQIGLLFANQTEIDQLYQAIRTLEGIMVLGGILVIIGVVVTALGCRSANKMNKSKDA